MRELTGNELCLVAGGGDIAEAAAVGGAIGGALGVGYGMSAGASGTAVLGMAGIGAAALSGLAASAAAGYAAGNWLNQNTPVQSGISSMLVWFENK
jgi:hypothetical protein